MFPRPLLLGLGVLALVVGFWNLGQGASVYGKAWLAQRLLEWAWQHSLGGASEVKPWPWADTYPVARLRVPSRNIDQIVLAGATGRTLAFGPGYMLASSLPGAGGAVLFSGHRDTHFGFLQNLRQGEEVFVQLPNGTEYGYRVSDARVADTRTSVLTLPPGAERLILVTCYPFDVVAPTGPLRYVVTAVSVGALAEQR